jgi:DNA recombination-dependent growth factor C
LSGSVTLTKFYVRGEVPKDFRRSFMKRVKLRTFQPLTPDEDVDEKMGWCAMGRATDLDLSYEKISFNSYITLGFRHDRWRIPTAVLRAQLEEAAANARLKTGQERLSSNQKEAIKQQVVQKLKRKSFPSLRAADFVWSLEREQAFFWSQSKAMIERLQGYFELTFGLELAQASPYLSGLALSPVKNTEAALAAVEPTLFQEAARGSR